MSDTVLSKIHWKPSRSFLALGPIVLGFCIWGICERRLGDAWLLVPPLHSLAILHVIGYFFPAILFARLPTDIRWLDRNRAGALFIFSIIYAVYLYIAIPTFC